MWYTCRQTELTSPSRSLYFLRPHSAVARLKRCCVNDIPRRGLHSGMTILNPAYKKKQKENSFPSHVPAFKKKKKKKKPCSYSVSSSTITCLSIANQSRAANPNRQSSKVASKNTSLALSQLQPIREGTYVAKLHCAPRGYANVKDLPHDLPSSFFFLSCKPCWCDHKPCMEKHRDIGSPCASECVSFVRRVIKCFCPKKKQLSNFGNAKALIK